MKSILKTVFIMASCLAMAGMIVSCEKNNDLTWEEEREKDLKDVAEVYVNKTVVPTYAALADNAMELAAICQEIEASVDCRTFGNAHPRVRRKQTDTAVRW